MMMHSNQRNSPCTQFRYWDHWWPNHMVKFQWYRNLNQNCWTWESLGLPPSLNCNHSSYSSYYLKSVVDERQWFMGTKALYTLLVLVVCDAVERAARRSKRRRNVLLCIVARDYLLTLDKSWSVEVRAWDRFRNVAASNLIFVLISILNLIHLLLIVSFQTTHGLRETEPSRGMGSARPIRPFLPAGAWMKWVRRFFKIGQGGR